MRGEAWILGRIEDSFHQSLQRFAGAARAVQGKGEIKVHLAVLGKLSFSRFKHSHGTLCLVRPTQRVPKADQGCAVIIRLQAQSDGPFVVSNGFRPFAERLKRPPQLKGDFPNIRIPRVQVCEPTRKGGNLPTVPSPDNCIELRLPCRKLAVRVSCHFRVSAEAV